MSIENKKTLEVYDMNAQMYMDHTIDSINAEPEKAERKKLALQEFIKKSYSSLGNGSKILEIGSADGENAKYLESLGYDVTASDVAKAFIEACKKENLNTIKFNVLEDEFDKKYNGIFCWRVFVHFTKEDVLDTLKKVYDNLEDNGIFVFNVMNGEHKETLGEWVDFEGVYHMGAERYYNYFIKEELDKMIKDINYEIISFHTEGGSNKDKWLVYVLKK